MVGVRLAVGSLRPNAVPRFDRKTYTRVTAVDVIWRGSKQWRTACIEESACPKAYLLLL